MTPTAFPGALRARWQTLQPREQRGVLVAAGMVALALLWWVGIAPALQVLRQAELQQHRLDTQLQQMQALASEARALQSRPALRYDDAVRALESSVKQGLGAGARLSIVGERATVTLKSVPATALAPWLSQARVNARALPVEVRLVRGTPPPGGGTGGATWDGTLVLALPLRQNAQ